MIQRSHEITRLEAFSDAVFGFSLTLLVVALEVPRSYAELMGLMGGFLSFACCFTLLLWIWHEHNVFFRRYGLQDGVTVVLNGALLFVVLFYVYPLKFMFDSLFARFVTAGSSTPEPMSLGELARASQIYALGFIAVFVMFALLYRHALRKREALALDALQVFDAQAAIGQHLVSATVGVIALAIATFAPPAFAPLSPTAFSLMGPSHWIWGSRAARRRAILESTLRTGVSVS
jgi:uncharacterized membrane protein